MYEWGDTINCKKKADCLEAVGTYKCKDGLCTEMLDFHCERRWKLNNLIYVTMTTSIGART